MKYKNILLFTIVFTILYAFAASEAGKKVAKVKVARGKVTLVTVDGKSSTLKKGQWINQGSVVKTAAKSFVRLSFIDKSTMNVGPNSEMKIEKFSKDEAGVINLISGKIRAKVTKDYLKMDKKKSKLFLKSSSAVMGVRGTDFVFTPKTVVLFEGSIVYNTITPQMKTMNLESIVNKGVQIKPGQFSVVSTNAKAPTIPAKMNNIQLKNLEKNETFADFGSKKKSKKVNANSVVPPGLSGDIVAADSKIVEIVEKVADIKIEKKVIKKESMQISKGFVDGDYVMPPDGSLVDIKSGTVIPMGKDDAVFDSNTGQWSSQSAGDVSASGDYIPPEGIKITENGELLKEVDGKVKKIVVDVKPLDQQKSLDKSPTVNIDIIGPSPASTGSSKNKQNRGPAPASTDDSSSIKPLGDLATPPSIPGCPTCVNTTGGQVQQPGKAPGRNGLPPGVFKRRRSRVNVNVNKQ